MSRLSAAWASISNSPRRAALAAAVAIGAVIVGVGFAVAVNSMRESPGVGQMPSASPSANGATATAAPTPSLSPTPTLVPPTPTPSLAPTPTPAEAPPSTPSPTTAPLPTAIPTATPWPTPAPGLTAEEACVGFEFAPAPISVRSLGELQKGMIGTWSGCVTTPWVAPYWVTITFRDDGTYRSHALAGSELPALYYGSDEDSPEKKYELNDLQADLEGIGQIDIFFWPGNVNRGDLRNIALMGDKLEFEFFHRGQYGPLTYQLYRRDSHE